MQTHQKPRLYPAFPDCFWNFQIFIDSFHLFLPFTHWPWLIVAFPDCFWNGLAVPSSFCHSPAVPDCWRLFLPFLGYSRWFLTAPAISLQVIDHSRYSLAVPASCWLFLLAPVIYSLSLTVHGLPHLFLEFSGCSCNFLAVYRLNILVSGCSWRWLSNLDWSWLVPTILESSLHSLAVHDCL